MSDTTSPHVPPSPETLAAAKAVLRSAGVPFADIPPVTDAERIANLTAANAMFRQQISGMSGQVVALMKDTKTLSEELSEREADDAAVDAVLLNAKHKDLIRSQALAMLGATTQAGALMASGAVFIPLVLPTFNRLVRQTARDAAGAIEGAFSGPTQGTVGGVEIDVAAIGKFLMGTPIGQMLMAQVLTWVGDLSQKVAGQASTPSVETVTLGVQIDGKTIGTIDVPVNASEDVVHGVLRANDILRARIEAAAKANPIKGVVAFDVIPGKMVRITTGVAIPAAPQAPVNGATTNDPLNPIGDAPSPDNTQQ